MKRVVRDLTLLYLAALLGAWALLYFGGDRWWPATVFLFSPRWILALPLTLLLPATVVVQPKMLPVYVLHLAILAFPICGVCVPLPSTVTTTDGGVRLRVMTCNLGGGDIRVKDLVAMIRKEQPDVVLLQECQAIAADEIFESLNWNCRREGLMAIGSPQPLGMAEVLARHEPYRHNVAALACQMEWGTSDDRDPASPNAVSLSSPEATPAPKPTIQLINVHLPTPRLGLQELLDNGIEGTRLLNEVTEYRDRVSANLAVELRKRSGSMVIAGDFNMPTDSQIYRRHWSQFHNAFSQRGWGLGYTKQTRWHGIRIDHVLSQDPWTTVSVAVLPSVGGDHCPQIVELRRRP